MTRHLTAVVLATAGLALASPASAGTTGTPMLVTATILDACVVVATPMAFGTLSILGGSSTDSTSLVTVTCTPSANYDVSMDNGQHATGGQRRMQNLLNNAYIPYEIYSDSGRSARWGNTPGTDTVNGNAGLVGVKLLTAYGRIPQTATSVKSGLYEDSVTVSVSF